MIQTINFGNALCCLNQENNDLLIELYIESSFPKENFIKIITTLSKEASINSFIYIKAKKTQEKENQIQNFKVISKGFIPIDVLILSHIITKTIFKIDIDYETI